MARGNPNPKTDHLKPTQFKKGVKHNNEKISSTLSKYYNERKDILFYVNEFENKSQLELEELLTAIFTKVK